MGMVASPPAQDLKPVATLEEKIRTFESLTDDKGTLLLWGGFSNLYLAQIDLAGNPLIAAKKIVSSDKRITGIAKPIAWNGGWLLAIRETTSSTTDQIRLIQLDSSGKVVQDLVWLKNFERISLPVFFSNGKDLKAAYFASTPKNGALFLATLSNLKKIAEPKQIKTFEGKVIYPPMLLGTPYDNAYALLIYHRAQKPPPMKFLLLDQNSGEILKDADIGHDGQAFRLSEPSFQVVDNKIRISWYESISKDVPPRLIVTAFTKAGGEVSRKIIPFESLDIPSLHLSWSAGSLSGVSSKELYLENKPAFLHTMLVETDPPSLQQTFIKPQLTKNQASEFPKLLQLDKSRKSGILLSNNKLFYSSYSETAKKEKKLKGDSKNLFQDFKGCIDAKGLKKECLNKARQDWQKNKFVEPLSKRNEKKAL